MACTEVIQASLAGLISGSPHRFAFETLAHGPSAIATWRDWHAVAEPLSELVERKEMSGAPDAYVIACVSDPAIDLLRSLSSRPVFGALRSGVAAALARAERFGSIAFVTPSVQRQRRVFQAMGVEHRCVGSLPLNLPMADLIDPGRSRPALAKTGHRLRDLGAEVVILGCAGMAGHRRFLEDEIGIPVIEPIQAAAVNAMLACL
ncbi:MAG: aspartate/glutamate racemase family protein [Ramlibacter sp.]